MRPFYHSLSLAPGFSQVFTVALRNKTVSTVLPLCEETVETVSVSPAPPITRLKPGVNERRFA